MSSIGERQTPDVNASNLRVYTYDELVAPTEQKLYVRFIYLDPNLSDDGRIQCSLLHGEIDRKGSSQSAVQVYHALSYEWGPTQNPIDIEVNGCCFSVRQNLWQYLDKARRTPELHQNALWVDAICINQDDIQERNRQVSCMGEVYANASRVIVWLGYGDSVVEATIEFLDQCYRSPAERNLTYVLDNMEEEYSPARVRAHHGYLGSVARDQFGLSEPIIDLFDRIVSLTYWTRAWIAQELFHAKSVETNSSPYCTAIKQITFHYGKQSTSFECLFNSTAVFKEFSQKMDPRFWRFTSLGEYMNILNSSILNLDLHDSFRIFNEWPNKSTDPRDLIYALRSMFFGGRNLIVEYRETLDLLLLRMLLQLKHPLYGKTDRNWLNYQEIKSVIDLASRFGMSMMDFQTHILDAAEELKTSDPRSISPDLQRQYKEALALLNTGSVQTPRNFYTLPMDMLCSSTDPCSNCGKLPINIYDMTRNLRNCNQCKNKVLSWDQVLSTTCRCSDCSDSILIPPIFITEARLAHSPASKITTHVWTESSDSTDGGHPCVLDLALIAKSWRVQFSLPPTTVKTFKHPEPLTVDVKTWLFICTLEDMQERYLMRESGDQKTCVQDFVREIQRIARPHLKTQNLTPEPLSFWFVATSRPGVLVTLDEFWTEVS